MEFINKVRDELLVSSLVNYLVRVSVWRRKRVES